MSVAQDKDRESDEAKKKKGVYKEQHFSSFNLRDDGHLSIMICGYIKLKLKV